MSAQTSTRTNPAARSTLVRAVRLTGVKPTQVAASVSLGTLALGCAVALGGVSAWLIARASQQPVAAALTVAATGVRAFGLGRGVFRYLERLVSHNTALGGMTTLRTQVYARLAEGAPEAVLRVRRGDLLARVGADVDEVGYLVVRALVPLGVAITLGVGTSVVVAILWLPAGVALAVCLLVAGWVAPMLTAMSVRRAEQRASAARARMNAIALGMLDDAGPMTVAGRTGTETTRLKDADDDIARAVDASALSAALASGLGLLAQAAAVVVALVTGVPAVQQGILAPTTLAVVVLTPLAAFEATQALPNAAIQLQRSRAAAARILTLLDSAAVVSPTAPRGTTQGATDATTDAGPDEDDQTHPAPSLRATGLVCGWTGRDPAVTGVDLELAVGRTLAVAGPSGAGKTTLLLTLAGLLPVRDGDLRLGDDDLAALDRADVVRAVVATTEDAHVFGTTVLENLRVARGDVTADEARSALADVGLAPWLASLPDGLDTLLGPDARTVSGGERRRLLLARALLVHAPLLLVDEPGEHLDPASADHVITDLLTARADRGVLVVTHRITPLAAADEVLWIEHGTVAARGHHDDLLATAPGYAAAARRELVEPEED
ncbi:MAG: thiol reductant ABC exporter subunit CydC [Micrococcales bacterium]|nr:thiol reductant ABC exporter subunit CydC [Micrococcales bacterium]MCL2667210.1 thiol reductant ABC exporter subunit CydC [Micrococcales bacterium]